MASPFDDLCLGPSSIPLEIAGSREFVQVTLPNARTAGPLRFHLDTGGNTPGLAIQRTTLDRLGLRLEQLPSTVNLGGQTVPLPAGARWVVLEEEDAHIQHETRKDFSEGQIGAGFLSRFAVCIDPGRARLGLADPSTLPSFPPQVPFIPLLLQSGGTDAALYPFVHLVVQDHGQPVAGYGVLVDTGATTSMLDRNKIEYLHGQHPEWPFATGAFGDLDMLGGMWPEQVLGAPDVAIDSPRAALARLGLDHYVSVDLGRATFVDRPTGTWDRMFGSLPLTMGSHGALANDVLLRYRLVLDYVHARLFLEPSLALPAPSASPVRIGLAVRFGKGGCPEIEQVTNTNALATRDTLRTGDIVLTVDGRGACSMWHDEFAAVLAGSTGTLKRLTLRRGDAVLDVSIPTASLLEPHPPPP